jgi:hypothetical protein
MIVIQGKRGPIRIHEPQKEPTQEVLDHFHKTMLKCILEIYKEQEGSDEQLEQKN